MDIGQIKTKLNKAVNNMVKEKLFTAKEIEIILDFIQTLTKEDLDD